MFESKERDRFQQLVAEEFEQNGEANIEKVVNRMKQEGLKTDLGEVGPALVLMRDFMPGFEIAYEDEVQLNNGRATVSNMSSEVLQKWRA